ncbi:MAG: F0F1 ATP synthase subunit epsilon [Chloroflexota bacterium]
MRLKLLLPEEVFFEGEVDKVSAAAENGSFTLLPRHIDFVAALVPGLLFLQTGGDGQEVFFAIDEGVLVKRGAEVLVSTRNAIRGPDLGTLKQRVEEEFMVRDEREKRARSAVAKFEADLVRRFLELQEERYE